MRISNDDGQNYVIVLAGIGSCGLPECSLESCVSEGLQEVADRRFVRLMLDPFPHL